MELMIILMMCKLKKTKRKDFIFEIRLFFDRNYDEDFEDEDDGGEESTNKKSINSAMSPPQRLGSTLNNKIDNLEDELKRWKD
jgi:hypothetical protein